MFYNVLINIFIKDFRNASKHRGEDLVYLHCKLNIFEFFYNFILFLIIKNVLVINNNILVSFLISKSDFN